MSIILIIIYKHLLTNIYRHANRGKFFHTSNGTISYRRVNGSSLGSKASRDDDGEAIFKDFIWANKDLMDKEVRDKFFRGDKQAIADSLNQIQWRSLKIRGGLEWKSKNQININAGPSKINKSFAEEVKSGTTNEGLKSNSKDQEWLIVNEVCHLLKSRNNECLILKLDFEKVFDTVNWNFLFNTMRNMGFGDKWISWIHSFFKYIRIFVLVNGSPTKDYRYLMI